MFLTEKEDKRVRCLVKNTQAKWEQQARTLFSSIFYPLRFFCAVASVALFLLSPIENKYYHIFVSVSPLFLLLATTVAIIKFEKKRISENTFEKWMQQIQELDVSPEDHTLFMQYVNLLLRGWLDDEMKETLRLLLDTFNSPQLKKLKVVQYATIFAR